MDVKIERKLVRKEAYFMLRDWIMSGLLAPGTKLRDVQLAEKMGVSRTPVREAILRLADEGFVQTKPGRSTYVNSIDFHDAFQLYSIVWTLEKLAMAQAFGSIKEQHIRSMVDANEKFLISMKNRKRRDALTADHDFHTVYVKLSANAELQKVLSELKVKLMRLDLYYFDKVKDAHLSYEEHKLIIEALQQKDLDKAIVALESNWKKSFERFKI